MSVDGCVPSLSLCGPVMNWRPVQGVPCLLPNGSWDRLQPPCNPKLDEAGIDNGWMDVSSVCFNSIPDGDQFDSNL